MNPDTPLAEVAGHLGREAAAYLVDQSSDVQTAVLKQVRSMVVFWEARRYVFDPIAYEGILDAVVPSLGALYGEVIRLRMHSTNLESRMRAADALIVQMSETIAAISELQEGQEP